MTAADAIDGRLQVPDYSGAKLMDSTRFSLQNAFDLRAKAFEKIREHSAAIDRLAAATEALDAAMQTAIDEKNIDEMQGLVDAARRLSDAMGGAK